MIAFIESVRHEEAILDRMLATVLFTDVVGSTEKACELGDRRWAELLERHHTVLRAMLARYRGTEAETAGDGFLATFDGPARAVRCAQAICDAVRPLGLEVRAGCHTGEIEVLGADIGRHRRAHRRPGRRPRRALRGPGVSPPSRTSSPAPASSSRTAASTSSRACPEAGDCSPRSRVAAGLMTKSGGRAVRPARRFAKGACSASQLRLTSSPEAYRRPACRHRRRPARACRPRCTRW